MACDPGYIVEPESVLPDPGSSHHSDFTNDFAGNCQLATNIPQGRGWGVGRGLGVGVGRIGVPVGVADGVTLGVTVALAVGVGVGLPAGQVPLTLNTICMFGKPMSPVGVGSFSPQSTALR